jgi:glycosyltransferase involved in cell wall biosynthesis
MEASAPVSVIMPCYRCGDRIERVVDSVAVQTCCPVEVILVDDASNDDSSWALYGLRNDYGRNWIKVDLRQENGYPAATRNTGCDIATEPYVDLLEANDAWHPRKIEIQLKYMRAHPEVSITDHRTRLLREGENFPSALEDYSFKPISK